MSTTVIAFFNNKGGVGKTSLVYHLAWMYSDLGKRVVAADLDPQANLTAAFLDSDRLEELWPDGDHPDTIFGCIQPLLKGTGDIAQSHLEVVNEQADAPLALLVGDLLLSGFEDDLSQMWPKCLDREAQRAFRVMSAFWRAMQHAAEKHAADVILMDLGPNLGAINRAALIAADYVVIPLSPDLFSLQGLRNLGPTLEDWRADWKERLKKWEERSIKNPMSDPELPTDSIEPAGYVVLQHSVREDRPVKAYEKWIARIPGEYRDIILRKPGDDNVSIKDDPNCLALLKHYRSLTAMAHEARKPVFHLKSADGALGSHLQAVNASRLDFEKLARKIAERTGIAF